MTVPTDSITDTSRGVYKVTGPCPEHGQPHGPGVVVTSKPGVESMTYHDISIDGRYAGNVIDTATGDDLRFVATASGPGAITLGWHSSLDRAVAAVVAVHRLHRPVVAS